MLQQRIRSESNWRKTSFTASKLWTCRDFVQAMISRTQTWRQTEKMLIRNLIRTHVSIEDRMSIWIRLDRKLKAEDGGLGSGFNRSYSRGEIGWIHVAPKYFFECWQAFWQQTETQKMYSFSTFFLKKKLFILGISPDREKWPRWKEISDEL